jgi:hypothetical protein
MIYFTNRKNSAKSFGRKTLVSLSVKSLQEIENVGKYYRVIITNIQSRNHHSKRI